MNAEILGENNLVVNRFFALDGRAYEAGALDVKTKELLGLVASLVLRCDDCVTYHVVRCQEEGVTRAEAFEALSIGLIVGGSIVIPHMRRAVAGGRSWRRRADPTASRLRGCVAAWLRVCAGPRSQDAPRPFSQPRSHAAPSLPASASPAPARPHWASRPCSDCRRTRSAPGPSLSRWLSVASSAFLNMICRFTLCGSNFGSYGLSFGLPETSSTVS